MKQICRELQNRLTAEGRHALRDDAAAQIHLEGCAECFAVLESMAQLDEAFAGLAMTDAPDAVVESILAQVKADGQPGPATKPAATASIWRHWAPSMRRRPMLSTAAAAVAVAVLVPLMVPRLLRAPGSGPSAGQEPAAIRETVEVAAERELVPAEAPARTEDGFGDAVGGRQREDLAKTPAPLETGERLSAFGYLQADGSMASDELAPPRTSDDGAGFSARRENAPKPAALGSRKPVLPEKQTKAAGLAGRAAGDPAATTTTEEIPVDELLEGGVDTEAGAVPGAVIGGVVDGLPQAPEGKESDGRDPRRDLRTDKDKKDQARLIVTPDSPVVEARGKGVWGASVLGGAEVPVPTKRHHVDPVSPRPEQRTVALEITIDPEGRVTGARVERSLSRDLDAAALTAVRQWRFEPTYVDGVAVPVSLHVDVSFVTADAPREERPPLASGPAYDFHRERQRTEGVRFQPATGYWSNTYIPGDPRVRSLSHELSGSPYAQLHEQARQLIQPFDAPEHSALAVYMHMDRRGQNGAGRMLVQIGLQASERSGQRHSTVDLALVLDLRGDISMDVASRMRALVLAFSQARQPGDRFSLIVAGRPGAVVVDPDAFRHGPLAISLDALFEPASLTAPCLDLHGAVSLAFERVGQADDQTRALGSSAVVLITGQSPGPQIERLTHLLHRGAVAAVPTSVVAVSRDVSPEDIDRLALAGQGQHRVLESRADAAALVERELGSASRAVARALRLRIRLAPGVELIDVVGAHRLDTRQADRVRETERAIDARLARHLGIEADRGDDEDGLQIVIPSFYAGDTHVILLDVVAQRPGRIAEVTARFKDLVFLRNGVARASASTRRDDATTGALELNVVKNQLALLLSDSLRAAAESLSDGDAARAEAVLHEAAELRSDLGSFYPGLEGDPELRRDATMLAGYLQALSDDSSGHPQLGPSLRYASHLKVLPRPAPVALSSS
jgi:TonB family protein